MTDISAQIKELVEHMLDLHKKLSAAEIPADKIIIQQQISAIDKQIGTLVQKLYDLTDEEIQIVRNYRKKVLD
jgi:phage-related minor tail protein